MIPAGLDARGLPLLTSALGSFGLPAQDLDDVMGGSVLRLLRATLPSDAQLEQGDARGAASKRHTTEGDDGLVYEVWL